ncbi:hypothetical protein RHGRI_025263 [Rhododendron griersonianum]|uniref:SUI1 domain-containing protein n=1 Tax=Rhododendron griersonianum TaxID=479676 RepID=A0AAV6JD98_9ERIC|nr:hypothetical protein RHGRI_025263 [Rhododendron griersonianum]
MVDLDVQIPTKFDPFAEADDDSVEKAYIHIRIQQRNGKKSLTTVQGTVVQDKELGKVIQLQGDQRKNVSNFLVQAGIAKKDQIKIHGF